MFLDEREGFDAVFALADEVDVGETLQQESQFVARRLFVVDDERVDRHGGSTSSARKVYASAYHVQPAERPLPC
jgi:fructose-specific component phosphotransferase system IIB-like protein